VFSPGTILVAGFGEKLILKIFPPPRRAHFAAPANAARHHKI